MTRFIPFAAFLVLAGCGSSEDPAPATPTNLEAAAAVSDPAAAAVLENAAEAGVNGQRALEAAGQAQLNRPDTVFTAGNDQVIANADSTVQARPNTVSNPNRPSNGQPIEKVDVANSQ